MFTEIISGKLGISARQIDTVLQLLEGGATIPFIARYRKDLTGALDEVQVQQIQDEHKSQMQLEERKTFIDKAITEQGKMTDTLKNRIHASMSITELEDLYLPYKQKRKTKADIARENGLAPLAELLMRQTNADPETEARVFINEKVANEQLALQGAREIIAEEINENITVRDSLRKLFEAKAVLQAMAVDENDPAAVKFKDYFSYSERIATVPAHRTLAILRGFLEGHLRISIEPAEIEAIGLIEDIVIIPGGSAAREHLAKAVKDGYKRLLQPSLETEFRSKLKAAADEESIAVFAENLRQLLLSAPLGSLRVLAIDPGYRTGCKVVCLDEKGELQTTALVFVHEKNRLADAAQKLSALVQQYGIQAFAVGDGTAGRETEQFVKSLGLGLPVYLVNEDGASIYSASEIARQEFPDHDLTIRGAVSIGRRLMDPLAELVKIDPKSIGVGQYQHDVNQPRLKEKLDQTVMSCVNSVGVNVNTASKQLLKYVSGISSTIADNIISYRSQVGKIKSRRELLAIPRLGEKAFEQCAGFLRITGGDHKLDESAVHPEAYPVAEAIAADLQTPLEDLIGNEKLLSAVNAKKFAHSGFGEHTINDIIRELKKPGLDPRSQAQQFEFAAIYSIEDVKTGMEVPGIVTNLTKFGAFVDIGVKQDGLVHVSEIAHKYIQDPAEVLKLNQQVKVKVMEVDLPRKRIALSIKETQTAVGKDHKKKGFATGGKNPAQPNMQDAMSALRQKFGTKPN